MSDIVVTMSDAVPALQGIVTGADSRDLVTPRVLMFPVARPLWTNYGMIARRLVEMRVSRDGNYRLPQGYPYVPPGDYYLIAVPQGKSYGWRSPAALEQLAGRASRITLSEGAVLNLNIPLVTLPE